MRAECDEGLLHTQEVRGSSPCSPTIIVLPPSQITSGLPVFRSLSLFPSGYN